MSSQMRECELGVAARTSEQVKAVAQEIGGLPLNVERGRLPGSDARNVGGTADGPSKAALYRFGVVLAA